MSALGRTWRWWVHLWDRQERPTALALARIGVALVLLWDLGAAWLLGLVEVLWTPPEVGGLPANLLGRNPVPEVYQLFPATTDTAVWLHGVTVLAAVFFGLGLFTRLSGLVLLLGYAQLALVLPLGDRGIDMLLRNVILVLILSPAGKMLSADARLKTGSWLGDGSPHPAWARHLLVLQLVVMYSMAGVQKTAITWTPIGGYHALYIILQDPHIGRMDFAWLESIWPLMSFSTFTTSVFELGAPLVLLAYHYRDSSDRPGRLRAFFLKWRVHHLWILVGVLLHLGIALAMNLGIFPFAILVLYPLFFHHDELAGALAWVRGRLGARGQRSAAATSPAA